MQYYCGSRDMPKWLRKILSYKFNDSCMIHDKDYSGTKFTKEEADNKFLENMLEQADGSPFWSAMAYAYYWAAKYYGKDKSQG